MAIGIFFGRWLIADILFFWSISLLLDMFFMLIKVYFNSNHVLYRPKGGWFIRIFPAISEGLLLWVSLLPPFLMLVIISMAYLDETIGSNYDIVAYFQQAGLRMWEDISFLGYPLLASFLIENILLFQKERYKWLYFRRYIRAFYFAHIIILPAFVLGILALHESEGAQNLKNTSIVFPSFIFLSKLVVDFTVWRWGYFLPKRFLVQSEIERKLKKQKQKKAPIMPKITDVDISNLNTEKNSDKPK